MCVCEYCIDSFQTIELHTHTHTHKYNLLCEQFIWNLGSFTVIMLFYITLKICIRLYKHAHTQHHQNDFVKFTFVLTYTLFCLQVHSRSLALFPLVYPIFVYPCTCTRTDILCMYSVHVYLDSFRPVYHHRRHLRCQFAL